MRSDVVEIALRHAPGDHLRAPGGVLNETGQRFRWREILVILRVVEKRLHQCQSFGYLDFLVSKRGGVDYHGEHVPLDFA